MDGRGYFNQGGYYNPYFQYQNQPFPFNMESPTSSGLSFNIPPPSSSASLSNQQPSSRSSSDRSDQESSKQSSSKAKKTYDKFTHDQQKMLVRLWAEKHCELESKDNRKVWEDITREINQKFEITRPTEKYKLKIKYLVEKYKVAKDWNKKQSGGHRRESPFFKELDEVLGCRDVVTLQHVADVGSTSASNCNGENSSDDETESSTEVAKEERKERKKSRKRTRADKEDEGEREMIASAFEGIQEQRESMNRFMENYTRAQEQQTQTMNALVGALTTFLQNNSKSN